MSQKTFFLRAQSAPIQRQLVSVMINGLSNKCVKFKLPRKNPSTLADEITVASTEETIRERYDIHFGKKHIDSEMNERDEQPMEVEAVRDRVCSMCQRQVHDPNIQLWHCNQKGHILDCPNRRGRLNKNTKAIVGL